MAIKNEDLAYAIDIQTAESKRNLDALTQSIIKGTKASESLDKTTEDYNRTITATSKTEQAYAQALDSSVKQMRNADGTFMSLEKSAKFYQDSLSDVARQAQHFDMPTQSMVEFYRAMNTSAEGAQMMADSLQGLSDEQRRFIANEAAYTQIFIEQETKKAKALMALEAVAKTAFVAIGAGVAAVFSVQLFAQISQLATVVMSTAGILQKGVAIIKGSLGVVTGAFQSTFRVMADIFKEMAQPVIAAFNAIRNNAALTVEAFLLIAPALGPIGEALQGMGMSAAQTAGSMVLLANSIAAVATVTLNLLLHAVSNAVIAIGEHLVGVMEEFTLKAAKAEQAAAQFAFTIMGFGRTFGAAVVGSLEQWNDIVEKLGDTTGATTAEIQKSIKLLIADGTNLGLSFEKTSKLMNRAAEISANSGLELTEVTQRLLQGIAGNSQAVLQLGINLHEHALEHSNLNKVMEKTVGTMTEMELKQVRLYEIFKQTEPIVGATAVQMETLLGVNQRIEKSFANISAKIGSNSTFIVKAKGLYADFINQVEKLPDAVYQTIGAIGDFGGILLTTLGYLTKYALTISSLTAIYKLFNLAVTESIVVQGILTNVTKTLGAVFAVQTVAVTSMTTLVQNLTMILKADLLLALKAISGMLGIVAMKILTVGKAILMNPLFIKGAVIATAIFALIEAFRELDKEFGFFSNGIASSAGNISIFSEMFDRLKKAVSGSFRVLVEFMKVVLIGLTAIGLAAARVGAMMARAFGNAEDIEAWNMYIEELDKKLFQLDSAANKSRENVANAFKVITGSTEAMAAGFEEAGVSISDFELRTKSLKKVADSIDIASIRVEVLGTEVEKTANSYRLASIAAAKASDQFIKGADNAKEVLDDYKKALEDQIKAQAQLEKTRLDTLKDITDRVKDLRMDELKSMKNQTLAINTEYDNRRAEITKYGNELAKLGPMVQSDAKAISDAFAQIEKSRKAALQADYDKKLKEGLEEENKLYKEQWEHLQAIQQKNRDIAVAIASVNATERQKITRQLQIDLALLDDQIFLEKARVVTDRQVIEALEKQRGLLIKNAALQKDMADRGVPDWIEELGEAIQEAFGKDTIDGWFRNLRDKIEEISNTPIVIEIQQKIKRVVETVGDAAQESGISDGLAEIGKDIVNGAKILYKAGGAMVSGIEKMGGWIGAIIEFVMNLDQYLRRIADFPAQFAEILKALPGIVQKIIDTFPQAINKIAEALPTIIAELVDKFPNFVDAILKSLPYLFEKIFEALPFIIIKIISALPKYILAIFKAMGTIVLGAIKGLIKGLANLFSGKKMPKIQLDTTNAQKTIKRLQGSTEKLFNVKDMAEAVKDPLDNLMDNISDTFQHGVDIFTEMWRWVMKNILGPLGDAILRAWNWVNDNIIQPIWNVVTRAWRWVYDNIIKPIAEIVMSAWKWVSDNIIKPIWDTITGAFKWVDENIIKPIGSAIQTAFNWVVENLLKPLQQVGASIAQPVMDAFRWIETNILKPLQTIGQQIAKPIQEAFAGISGFFQGIGNALKSLFKLDIDGFARQLSEALQGAFAPIVNGIRNVLNGIIDFINNIELPGVDVSFKVLGKKVGFGWGPIDLVPGNIPHLATGGFVGPEGMLPGTGEDRVPRMLDPGEFVINKKRTAELGANFLNALNSGKMPASGGDVNIDMGGITITVQANKVDENFVKKDLVPKIMESIKRASQDGHYVLNSRGIRTI